MEHHLTISGSSAFSRPWARSAGSRRGSVLVLTIAILLMMMVLVWQFTNATKAELATARNLAHDFELNVAMRGATNWGLARLRDDDVRTNDALNHPWAQPYTPPDLENIKLTAITIDEARKINLLGLVNGPSKNQAAARKALVFLIQRLRLEDSQPLGQNEAEADELVDTLVEWLRKRPVRESFETSKEVGLADVDDQIPEGEPLDLEKESPFPMVTVGELRFLGFTSRLLYGPDNSDFIREEQEADTGETAGAGALPEDEEEYIPLDYDSDEYDKQRLAERDLGLVEYVTIHSRGPVNVNTASKPVLCALLWGTDRYRTDPYEDPERRLEQDADEIIRHRQYGPEDASQEPVINEETGEEEEPDYSFKNLGEVLTVAVSQEGQAALSAMRTGDSGQANQRRARITVRSYVFSVRVSATKQRPPTEEGGVARDSLTRRMTSIFARDQAGNFKLVMQDIE